MQTFKPKSKSIGYILITSFLLMSLIFVGGLFLITQRNFTNYMDDSVDIQTDEISRQIVYNYENLSDTLINTSNILQEELLNHEIDLNYEYLHTYFSNAVNLNNSFINISLFDTNGDLLLSANESELSNALLETWYIEAFNDSTKYYFSNPIEENQVIKIIISKNISINHHNEDAILKIEVDFNRFIDLALKSNLGTYGHVTLFNNSYEIIYTSKNLGSISDFEEISLFKNTVVGSSQTKINQETMMLRVETITNTPWRIGIFINIHNSKLVRDNFVFTLIMFLVLFVIIWSSIYIFIAKKITSPLVTLANKMRNIESTSDIKLNPVNFDFPQEVEVLSHSYNVLMERIDNLLNQVIIEQKEQRKSELWALQNQINPHFLYNTLDSIVWMVENNENDAAVKMIVSLSRLFKISISGGANMIEVKNEIEHAKHYLFIQSFRFKDKFNYEIIIDDERVLNKKILKLILQPLIENAIYHGIDKTSNNGKIIIRAGIENHKIMLMVEDNGYGMTKEKIDALYQKIQNPNAQSGVGLKNVYQRLKVYYQERASLTITSDFDSGTKIKILIPMEEEV